MQLVGDAAENI